MADEKSNYEQLKKKADDNNVKFYLVLSPPRSGSTLMGRSLSFNSEIDNYCHEPCFNLKYVEENSELVYKEIAESLNDKKSMVIKEMTQWADIKNEHIRLAKLTKDRIIFLIRNPIIATESKIRRSIMTYNKREKSSVKQFLSKKFSDETKSQNELLDLFATEKNYENWSQLLEKTLKERDYNDMAELIDQENIFSLFDLGWESIKKETEYFKKDKVPFVIVDNTQHLLFPEEISKKICEKLNLKYDSKMINWGHKENFLNMSSQEESFQTIWYDTLKKSNRILEPSEIPIPLTRFPKRIADYLLSTALPIYIELFNSEDKLEIKESNEDIENKDITIPLNSLAKERLKELGVIDNVETGEDELKDKSLFIDKKTFTELLFDKDESDSHGAILKMVDMDPVYCSINNPNLINKEFIEKNKSYESILKIIKND